LPAQALGPQVPTVPQTTTITAPTATLTEPSLTIPAPPVIAEPVKTISFETKEYATPFNLQTEVEGRLVSDDRVKKVTLFITGEGLQDTAKLEQLATDLAQGALKVDLEMELQFPQWISKEQLLRLLERVPVPLIGQVKAKIEMERRRSQDNRAAWDKYLEEFKEQR